MRRSLNVSSQTTGVGTSNGGRASGIGHGRGVDDIRPNIPKVNFGARRQSGSILSVIVIIRSRLRYPVIFVIMTLSMVWMLDMTNIRKHRTSLLSANNLRSPNKSPANNYLANIDNRGNHSIAVLVPYRDLYTTQKRSEQYGKFIPHMIQFFDKCLTQKQIKDYHIYIIEQTNDGLKFNRGKLLNIGYDYIKRNHLGRDHDILIFHDIDLLPAETLIPWYTAFPEHPIHLAHVWAKYGDLAAVAGGVLSISMTDFEKVDGYPNKYWGWGGEDYAFAYRLFMKGITIQYATKGTYLDLEGINGKAKVKVLQTHNEWRGQNLFWLFLEQFLPWKKDGISTVTYKIIGTQPINNSTHATKVTSNVSLNGNDWTNNNAQMNYNDTTWINYFLDCLIDYS